jgi:hypothetical protein
MIVSDGEVIAKLTASGAKIEDYFLIGHDICTVNPNGQLVSTLIEEVEGEEEGDMYYAILDFLGRRGAKVYQSHQEYFSQ